MATLTCDGFWPDVQPAATTRTSSRKTYTGKTLMERFTDAQERRARARIADILGTYDVEGLRRLGLSEEDIRRLIGSRFISAR